MISFQEKALNLFKIQAKEVPVYRDFLKELHLKSENIKTVEQIPFLPIQFFKSQKVLTDTLRQAQPDRIVFCSSGTTGITTSKHHVPFPEIYEKAILDGFYEAFGSPNDYKFFSLLPSYLERKDSSLVYMMNYLHTQSEGAFYRDDFTKLIEEIYAAKASNKKVFLIGVSYALLDLALNFKPDFSGCIIIETGGMKGRGTELTREELHQTLKVNFNLENIYSEYGMTELLSQAYTRGGNVYYPSSALKILIRNPYDPFEIKSNGQVGLINIIDLTNEYSCAFIATDDVGKVYEDGSFEVLGRMEGSDMRGCNLLYL